jgi:DNA polymerase-3 subunit epsilon
MSPSLSDNKTNAIDKASQILINRPLYLDTETTGIEKTSEIVEIAIVDDDGNQLFQSLVKPSKPIPASAMAIHGITNQMVAGSPTFPILWQKIRPLFGNQMIGAYNSEFDVSIINQSYTVYHLPFKDTINHFAS